MAVRMEDCPLKKEAEPRKNLAAKDPRKKRKERFFPLFPRFYRFLIVFVRFWRGDARQATGARRPGIARFLWIAIDVKTVETIFLRSQSDLMRFANRAHEKGIVRLPEKKIVQKKRFCDLGRIARFEKNVPAERGKERFADLNPHGRVQEIGDALPGFEPEIELGRFGKMNVHHAGRIAVIGCVPADIDRFNKKVSVGGSGPFGKGQEGRRRGHFDFPDHPGAGFLQQIGDRSAFARRDRNDKRKPSYRRTNDERHADKLFLIDEQSRGPFL